MFNGFSHMQEDILMMGGRYAMDGCATFFRRDRFTLVKKYEVEFNKAAQSYVETISDQSERRKHEHRLMKPNVALILVLEGTDGDTEVLTDARNLVCVANTHIHSNQDLPDVKLWQVQLPFVSFVDAIILYCPSWYASIALVGTYTFERLGEDCKQCQHPHGCGGRFKLCSWVCPTCPHDAWVH